MSNTICLLPYLSKKLSSFKSKEVLLSKYSWSRMITITDDLNQVIFNKWDIKKVITLVYDITWSGFHWILLWLALMSSSSTSEFSDSIKSTTSALRLRSRATSTSRMIWIPSSSSDDEDDDSDILFGLKKKESSLKLLKDEKLWNELRAKLFIFMAPERPTWFQQILTH